jgi:hypothetical protein
MKTTVKLLLLVGLLIWTIVTAAITFAFLQARDEIRGNTISIQQQMLKMKVPIKEQVESPQNEVSKTFQDLVYALGMVEVGTAYQDSDKRGLAGELGPLQITRAYWKDSNIPGKWEDCRSWEYSVKVLCSYLRRYAKEALQKNDFETLARIHNGGPRGAKKPQTARYWAKVQRYL